MNKKIIWGEGRGGVSKREEWLELGKEGSSWVGKGRDVSSLRRRLEVKTSGKMESKDKDWGQEGGELARISLEWSNVGN